MRKETFVKASLVVLGLCGARMNRIRFLKLHPWTPLLNKMIQFPKNEEEKVISFIGVGDNLIHDSIFRDAELPDGTYDFKFIYENVQRILKRRISLF